MGLEGDCYAAKGGTFTPTSPAARGYDLTLIEAEKLEDLLLADHGRLSYADARRNVVTRGIDLNALIGRTSASATSSAWVNACASPALTSNDSPARACSAASSTKGACGQTSSPTESSSLGRLSKPSTRYGTEGDG